MVQSTTTTTTTTTTTDHLSAYTRSLFSFQKIQENFQKVGILSVRFHNIAKEERKKVNSVVITSENHEKTRDIAKVERVRIAEGEG